MTDSLLKRKWQYDPSHQKLNAVLFTVGNEKYTFGDFASYLETKQKSGRIFKDLHQMIDAYYIDFENEKLDEFFKISLEIENKEFVDLLQEYKDGLLIFDLMQNTIWSPSKNDSLAIQEFFNKNRANYRWLKRVDASIGSSANQSIATQIQSMLKENQSIEEIQRLLNKEGQVNVTFTNGIFELDHIALPPDFEPIIGVSRIYEIKSSTAKPSNYVVVKVNAIIPETLKELDETRGKVMNDYQQALESHWLQTLRKKYKVEVSKKPFK